MSKSSRSPEVLAWISLFLSLIIFAITFLVGAWSQFMALGAVSWLALSAVMIWLVLALQFRQRALAEREKLDMGQLAQDHQTSTIFQAGDERVNLLAVAQRRLEVFERWFLPVFAILIAIYQVTMGILLMVRLETELETEGRRALIAAVVATGVAFVSFLMSRYATGMSSEERWRPLRAGGSSFLLVAIFCFVMAMGLGAAVFHFPIVIHAMNWVVPGFLVLLGFEILINVILDIYRPRVAGQYNRAAFDSRILGVINEPGGVFHSVAAAIDYQFGFQVSQTWFYRLLEKAILPLILFGALSLYSLDGIVVIAPGYEAIVERFGNPMTGDGEVRHWKPGVHFKWPWPVDRVVRYPTDRIEEIHVGYKPKVSESDAWTLPEPLLWGKGHFDEEYIVLVATDYIGNQADQTPPVGLLNANIPVHYRVKDLYAFLYNHAQPKALLEAICYNQLTQVAAASLTEVSDAGSGKVSLLGDGRVQAGRLLRQRIQQAIEDQGLGLEVVFLGVQGIHPPAEADVAVTFQKVVGAGQDKQTQVLRAHAAYNSNLSELAGSVGEANTLYRQSLKYQQLRAQAQSEDLVEDIAQDLDAALRAAKGEIFATLRRAQAYAFEKPTLAKARGERFVGQTKAYQAAPNIYPHGLRLQAMRDTLAQNRKYVIQTDPKDREVSIVNLEEKLMPSLYDIGALEETEP
jgi:regulator of protease activity HflC (stomatin/prohibitin superfamily)